MEHEELTTVLLLAQEVLASFIFLYHIAIITLGVHGVKREDNGWKNGGTPIL